LIYGVTEDSYRKTSNGLNRIRHQEVGGTPSRTVKAISEREGSMIAEHLEEQAIQIFQESGFTPEGEPKSAILESLSESITIEEDGVNEPLILDVLSTPWQMELLPDPLLDGAAPESIEASGEGIGTPVVNDLVKRHGLCDASRLEMLKNPVPYEEGEDTVNISVDEVGAKKQKETRAPTPVPKSPGKKNRLYVQNAVIHVEQGGQSYVLNGYSVACVLRLLLAFLLNSDLLDPTWVFFVDGNGLYSSVMQFFFWHPKVSVILDWYHLRKKCRELLSMALKGSPISKAVLGKLMPLLWYGLVDQAIDYLRNLPEDQIKNQEKLQQLIAYLDKNRVMIPVYAVRRELGLRNSSNRVEKANDVLVAARQKHNGMSWSKSGSVALASITGLKKNKTYKTWFQERKIEFKLAAQQA